MTCEECFHKDICLLKICYSMGDDEATGKAHDDMEKKCSHFLNGMSEKSNVKR